MDSHCGDKIPHTHRHKFKEERFILAHRVKDFSLWSASSQAKASWWKVAHTMADRKQRQEGAGSECIFKDNPQ